MVDFEADDFTFQVSEFYLGEEHIEKFINDVESYIDMEDIKDYQDLKNRLSKFFAKKNSKEPYKHQVDIFATKYGLKKPKEIVDRVAIKRQRMKTKKALQRRPKTYYEDGVQRIEKAKIKDKKENKIYLEPVYFEVVKMTDHKKKESLFQEREVIYERHIPWFMVKKGYQYRVRDKKTGRIVKWVK